MILASGRTQVPEHTHPQDIPLEALVGLVEETFTICAEEKRTSGLENRIHHRSNRILTPKACRNE